MTFNEFGERAGRVGDAANALNLAIWRLTWAVILIGFLVFMCGGC